MKGLRTKPGHVLSVATRRLGSALDGNHTAGATFVTVEDCSDFDDNIGGSFTLNGVTYTYDGTDVDDDASTIAISPVLAADGDDGDEVTILDPVLGGTQWASEAAVTVDGEDPGDTLTADIDSSVVQQLPEGIRGLAGENVTLQWDANDQLSIIGLAGLNDNQAGFVRGYQDSHVTVSSTDLTFGLTYRPLPGSTVHLYWNGLLQEDDAWTLDGVTVTVDDADGLVEAGDRFYAKYLYTDPTPTPIPPPPPNPLDSLTILGRWDLDDTSGTTAVATLGSDGAYVNSPTLGQSPLVSDGGKAVATDWHSSQDITLPLTGLSPGAAEPGWIMFDFKYGGTSNPFSTIVFRDDTDAISQGIFLDVGHTNPLVAQGGGSTGGRTITSITSASLLDGARHEMLLGFELDDRALWIDGVLVDTWTVSPGGAPYFWAKVTSPLHFGRFGSGSQYNSFTYDRVMVGSDPLATLSGLALDIWHAAGGA